MVLRNTLRGTANDYAAFVIGTDGHTPQPDCGAEMDLRPMAKPPILVPIVATRSDTQDNTVAWIILGFALAAALSLRPERFISDDDAPLPGNHAKAH